MNSKRESHIQNSRFKPQKVEFTMLPSEELGTQKSTSSRLIKITWRSRLQNMNARISGWLSKLQERSFKSFKKRSRNRVWTLRSQSHKGTKSYYGKGYLLPEKSSPKGWHHPSRYDHESTRGDVFWFWNHLTMIIFEEDYKKALKFWVLSRTLKVL